MHPRETTPRSQKIPYEESIATLRTNDKAATRTLEVRVHLARSASVPSGVQLRILSTEALDLLHPCKMRAQLRWDNILPVNDHLKIQQLRNARMPVLEEMPQWATTGDQAQDSATNRLLNIVRQNLTI